MRIVAGVWVRAWVTEETRVWLLNALTQPHTVGMTKTHVRTNCHLLNDIAVCSVACVCMRLSKGQVKAPLSIYHICTVFSSHPARHPDCMLIAYYSSVAGQNHSFGSIRFFHVVLYIRPQCSVYEDWQRRFEEADWVERTQWRSSRSRRGDSIPLITAVVSMQPQLNTPTVLLNPHKPLEAFSQHK